VGRSWHGLSHREIEQVSKLPKSTVAELSFRTTWKGVEVDVVEAFSAACGVNHLSSKRSMFSLQHRKMSWTDNGSMQQKAMYVRLFETLASLREQQTP
jgi:hypothetical protein